MASKKSLRERAATFVGVSGCILLAATFGLWLGTGVVLNYLAIKNLWFLDMALKTYTMLLFP